MMNRFTMPITRRKSIAHLLRGGSLLGLGAFGYGSLIERRRPVIERVDCQLPERHRQLGGLKIAFLSDFHHDEFTDNRLMSGAIDLVNELAPDLVMLGGDYISHDIAGLDTLTPHLAKLIAPLGNFGVLGNHDQWTDTAGCTRRLQDDGGIEAENER